MSVKTNQMSFKQGTVLATLLGCSALYLPLNAEAATASAKTSWAVSRVASTSLGSYCTMAQKYSDETVLTFAQNTKGEYSLALDFKNAKFTGGKKQSISIAADGGKAKSFDVVPQTDKTAVIAIGKDADFIKRISGAKQLGIKAGTESADFGLSEFTAGQKEMDGCIEALQKPADDKPAEKMVAKSSPPIIHKNEVALKPVEVTGSKEPSVEGLLAAMPKPSADIVPVQDEIVAISPVKSDLKEKTEKAASNQLEVASLREENARLSRALSEQRKSFEDKQLNSEGAALNEVQEKLEAARAENRSLNDQLVKLNANAPILKEAASKGNADSLKLTETVNSLQQENQTLKNQIQIYATAKNTKDGQAAAAAVNADALAKLQSENAELKQVITALKTAPKEAPVAVASVSDDEVNKLRADNRKLSNELDLAKTEKTTLQTQTASLQKDLENKQLKMSGGSWDLEQATRRYQESQREIVRLGSILQSKDVKCANEKKDIEYMLFDPAIATKAQIAMLNSMEDQIKEKDAQLQSSQGNLAQAKTQESPDKDAKIAELQKSVAQNQAELAEKTQLLADAQAKIQQAQTADKDVAALKADLNAKSQQLGEAHAKIQQAQTNQTDLAAKTQQLTDAQAKLALAGQTQLSLTQKDAELASVKTQLAQTQAQLANEQAAAQKIDVKAQAQQSAEQAASIAALQLQVQQANQTVIQLQNQIATNNQAAIRAASVVAPVVAAPVAAASGFVQPISYTAPQAAPAVHFKSVEDFSALLKNAGVSVRGAIQQVKGGDPSSYRAYSWKTDSLYGSAEMRKVSDASQFDAAVTQYLSRAKSRCTGEFAAVPSPVKATGMAQSKAYEIACVGQAASSSASVLFTYGNQITTIIAHEGRAEAMDLAIDARDRVSSKIN